MLSHELWKICICILSHFHVMRSWELYISVKMSYFLTRSLHFLMLKSLIFYQQALQWYCFNEIGLGDRHVTLLIPIEHISLLALNWCTCGHFHKLSTLVILPFLVFYGYFFGRKKLGRNDHMCTFSDEILQTFNERRHVLPLKLWQICICILSPFQVMKTLY